MLNLRNSNPITYITTNNVCVQIYIYVHTHTHTQVCVCTYILVVKKREGIHGRNIVKG